MSRTPDSPDDAPVVDPLTGEPLPDRIRLPIVEGRPLLLVIDNYDSFTYNLVQYLEELGAETRTHRNDEITLDEARRLDPDGIVISPGPGNPKNERDFGVSGPILKELSPTTPTLGVCLGLQGFAHLYQGDVTYAKTIMHGKTSTITHNGKRLFAGVPNPLAVGRYHSLVADPGKISDELEVTATTEDQEIMGIDHRHLPIMSVQFHPESILTQHGKTILRNFLQIVVDHKSNKQTTEASP
jgi:anthranilate synthase/aminodeoxychorismate synthase-like glutamine amidotransferase